MSPRARLVVAGVALIVLALLVQRASAPRSAPSTAPAPADAGPAALPIGLLRSEALELGVATTASAERVQSAATRAAIAKRLTDRHCGPACEPVRTFVESGEGFSVEVVPAGEWILPAPDALEDVAPRLSAEERAEVARSERVIAVRATAPVDANHMAVRAAYAAALALADELGGYVDDEAALRIDAARDVALRAVRVPLGAPVFSGRRIAVQLTRVDDGHVRLFTSGMARFGAPDLEIARARAGDAEATGSMMLGAAAALAAQRTALPLVVTRRDVASALEIDESRLGARGAAPGSVSLTVDETDRQEGDPDNELLRLVPAGGAEPDGYATAAAALLGHEAPPAPMDDEALARARREAAASLAALAPPHGTRDGTLYVRGRLADVDGGAESLWIRVDRCDARACSGRLANHPTRGAALELGDKAHVDRSGIDGVYFLAVDGGALQSPP